MYNPTKTQPISNASNSNFLDYSNIVNLDDYYTKQTPLKEDSVSTSSMSEL